MKKNVKLVSLVLALLVLLSLCGCNAQKLEDLSNTSTTCGNIVMGNGKFAYDNGFIYFTDRDNIYEYEVSTEKTIVISSNADTSIVPSLFVKDKYVFFSRSGLAGITRDGKKTTVVFEREGGCIQLFVDGDIAYYLDGKGGTLFRRKLDSEEEILFDGVLSYYIDEQNIYVASATDGARALYISPKTNIAFVKQPLSFEPIAVFAHNDKIYLSTKSTYQLVELYNGTETVLPIASTYYQVANNQIVYLDGKTYKNSCFTLKCYDLSTGETVTICEDVYDFNILDKYICMQCSTGNDAVYRIYNADTKITSTMKDLGG